ncbi:hypothetical protein POM88_014553 [Heracleum sosnowskyi]|uniref:Uncharacterized protein n=1 Tax=Heracleum sosnowskyi TaxID=360622 RepID=A0AAD8J0L3_9APIA|nr:hypothetical protein POM88_014553 [Heracleum sosnowskyi]
MNGSQRKDSTTRRNIIASNPKVEQVASYNTIVNVRWVNVEDATLDKSLLKLIEDCGWKAENGPSKSSVYGKLEKLLEEIQPGCGMKARPHIESWVRPLRKQYSAIVEMRGPNFC